jgi:hypothetical protein
MKKIALLPALLAAVALTPASAMDLATYVRLGEGLKSKGPLAPFSRDYKILMAELQASSKAIKQERLAALAAGRKPAYCPTSGINLMEVFSAFQAVPPAQRARLQVKDALRKFYVKKFPCPA